MSIQHVGDCRIRDVVTGVGQCSLNSIIAACGILSGESKDGTDDCLTDARSAVFSFLAGIAVLRDEFAVPAESCVWRENGRQFQQSLAANRVGFHREQPTLIVIQEVASCRVSAGAS